MTAKQQISAPIEHQPDLLVRSHSKHGIASLLIAVGLPIGLAGLAAVLLVLQVRIENEAFTYFVIILGSSVIGIVGHLLGLILGVVGARQKERKKLFAVLGIVFNSIPLLLSAIVCLLFVAFLLHPFPLGPK